MGESAMKFEAVVFDLDGTLLDTLEDLAESFNRALAAFGFSTHPVEAYKLFVGDGPKEVFLRAEAAARDDDAVATKLVAAMRNEYSKRWAERTRPYAGIRELLDALTRRGAKMAVVSNKPHDFVELCVSELLPHWRFEVVCGVDERTAAKPDPAGTIGAASLMGVDCAKCLYLGDTNTDMKTAAAAGMFAVGALWGFRTAEELLAAGAEVLAKHPAEVLDYFER